MNPKVPCHIIIHHVADEFGVKYSDIVSRRKGPTILSARRAAYAVVSEMRKDLPIIVIGRAFRGRDHSTILKTINKAKLQKREDAEFSAKWDAAQEKAYAWRPPESFEIFSKVGGVEAWRAAD